MPTILSRHTALLRSYGVAGRAVNRIIFYRHGAIVCIQPCGWLEYAEGEDAGSVTVSDQPRRAHKLNLDRGGHFYMVSPRTAFGDKEYDLYLDLADDFTLGERFERDAGQTATATRHDVLQPIGGIFDGVAATVLIRGEQRHTLTAYGEKHNEIVLRMEALNYPEVAKQLHAIVSVPGLFESICELVEFSMRHPGETP